METVLHYRRMALNPRYGTVGLLGVPFFVLTEVVAPFFEIVSVGLIVAGFATGTFSFATARSCWRRSRSSTASSRRSP